MNKREATGREGFMKRLVALVTAKGWPAIRDGHTRALSLSSLTYHWNKLKLGRRGEEEKIHFGSTQLQYPYPLKGVVKILFLLFLVIFINSINFFSLYYYYSVDIGCELSVFLSALAGDPLPPALLGVTVSAATVCSSPLLLLFPAASSNEGHSICWVVLLSLSSRAFKALCLRDTVNFKFILWKQSLTFFFLYQLYLMMMVVGRSLWMRDR